MQLAPVPTTAPTPLDGPVLADFTYVIRGPEAMPRMGHIEARAWPTAAVPGGATFDDAVRSAKLIAAKAEFDGIHGIRIQQAQGLLQAVDGSFSIVPLGGFHREHDGPLFVDGKMFEAAALSMQVARRVPELVAVVGAERVLDLRHTGSAVAVPGNQNPPRR